MFGRHFVMIIDVDSCLRVTLVTITAVETHDDFSPTFILKYFKKNRCFLFFLKLLYDFLYRSLSASRKNHKHQWSVSRGNRRHCGKDDRGARTRNGSWPGGVASCRDVFCDWLINTADERTEKRRGRPRSPGLGRAVVLAVRRSGRGAAA